MSRYYFRLLNGKPVDDRPDGMDLPDDEAARQHAIAVANDLARNRSPAELRDWIVAVLDSEDRRIFDIPLGNIPEK
jgi:hypothetical protein